MIAELAMWGLGLFAATEAAVAFGTRRSARRKMYAKARAASRRLRKPLLVVGDPDTGFVTKHFGRDYGCGDTCTDVSGCGGCPSRLPGRLEDVLPRLPAKSRVIFVCLTLEYVDDLPKCIRELERVAVPGGLFVLTVEPGSSTFWLYPGAKWVLYSTPPAPAWVFRRVSEPASTRSEIWRRSR